MNQTGPAQQSLQLKDIHMPVSPELWPPAPGWWMLALFASVLAVWISIRLFGIWRRKKTQLEIFSLLDELSNSKHDTQIPEFLLSVSTLLRRVALLRFPRKQVAGLTGKDWLTFLDVHGGNGQFVSGAGSVLESGPYTRSSNVDQQGLLLLARKWIKKNTAVI